MPGWRQGLVRAFLGGGPATQVHLRDTDETVPPPAPLPQSLKGGRASNDYPGLFLGNVPLVIAPPDPEGGWRLANLDEDALSIYDPAVLLQMLADLSPDVSKAMWDFLRMCNPGYSISVLTAGTQAEDTVGQGLLDGFLAQLHDLYGSFDVILNRLYISAFLRGAFFAELVLAADAKTPVDMATPDPWTVRFQWQRDPVRGGVWTPGQYGVGGKLVLLTRPTVRYVPVDPFPASPYGRPLASPALFSSIFMLGLLHDLRRVVAQQGLPRLDIGVNTERLMAVMPDEDKDDPERFMAWVNAVVKQITDEYTRLEPDDTYVHADVVQMNRPVGTVDANSLGMIDALFNQLSRMSARSLKTMPMMMGITDGVSEANANRQWELQNAGIESLQHLNETMLARLFALGLQAQGHPAVVKVRFSQVRASERLRDAQAAQVEIDNAISQEGMGYISHDEAAQMLTGSKANGPIEWLPRNAQPLSAGMPQANSETEPGGGIPAGTNQRDGELADLVERVASAIGRAKENGNGHRESIDLRTVTS
jgi:hypothetical protein